MKKIILSFILSALVAVPSFASVPDSGTESKSPHFDRGIDSGSNSVFIPKGTLMTGLSFSYINFDFNDYKFLVVDNLTASGSSFGIAPHASYFIKDNLSVGGRFDFKSQHLAIGGASLSLSDDLGLDISNYNMLKRSYLGSAVMRYYMPIANSLRFGLFTEIRLTGGYGQSKNYEQVDVNKYGTYQEMIQLELGLVPGICVFVTNDVAFEVSIGVLGFDYQSVKQYTNQVYEGTYEKSGANFKINLLNINFGITYFIPLARK